MMFSAMHPPNMPPSSSHDVSPASTPRITPTASTRDDDDLPSKIMTTAQYLRLHANATPAKLRAIIKDIILVHDDVDYLKRLVRDVGGMDYVFRFLWYDGPVPTDGGLDSGDKEGKQSQTNPESSNRSRDRVGKPSNQAGRSWIQHCCYHNAHQCLQYIFQEIVRNHLCKERQHRERLREERQDQRHTEISPVATDVSERQGTPTERSDGGNVSRDDAGNGDDMGEQKRLVEIIQQLLEFPSPSYCGTHYVAVATLRNSYQCLSLLLEYGGLDPNAPINAHGATAAHLAAWKDHVECLRVLHSGIYECRFDDGDEIHEGLSLQSDASNYESADDADHESQYSPREAFCSMLTASPGKEKRWSAEWTQTNALGETPLHVAAREGSTACMQYFLDLAVASATGALEAETEGNELPCVDFSVRNNDGMDCAALAAKHDQAKIITLIWGTIERLVDLSIDGPVELASPSPFTDFWQNPLSYFQPSVAGCGSPPTAKPPQSVMPTNRRRTKSEPFNLHSSKVPSPVMRLAQSPHSHHLNQQQCLPHYFPTLNLRNSHEEHNHEMPIHVAARYGNCAVIEALFKSGNCDASARDSLGQTALHVAAQEGHGDACQLFVYLAGDQFENFDVVDILGRTPLYIACSLGNSSLVRILMSASNWRVICHERKKSPDGPLYADVAQQPPLHAAIVNDHVNTVSTLLDCGVDVDQPDMLGRTGISLAAKLGLQEMCQMLILHGANLNTRSTRGGPTPYQKAKKYKHPKVADLLYEFGGR